MQKPNTENRARLLDVEEGSLGSCISGLQEALCHPKTTGFNNAGPKFLPMCIREMGAGLSLT